MKSTILLFVAWCECTARMPPAFATGSSAVFLPGFGLENGWYSRRATFETPHRLYNLAFKLGVPLGLEDPRSDYLEPRVVLDYLIQRDLFPSVKKHAASHYLREVIENDAPVQRILDTVWRGLFEETKECFVKETRHRLAVLLKGMYNKMPRRSKIRTFRPEELAACGECPQFQILVHVKTMKALLHNANWAMMVVLGRSLLLCDVANTVWVMGARAAPKAVLVSLLYWSVFYSADITDTSNLIDAVMYSAMGADKRDCRTDDDELRRGNPNPGATPRENSAGNFFTDVAGKLYVAAETLFQNHYFFEDTRRRVFQESYLTCTNGTLRKMIALEKTLVSSVRIGRYCDNTCDAVDEFIHFLKICVRFNRVRHRIGPLVEHANKYIYGHVQAPSGLLAPGFLKACKASAGTESTDLPALYGFLHVAVFRLRKYSELAGNYLSMIFFQFLLILPPSIAGILDLPPGPKSFFQDKDYQKIRVLIVKMLEHAFSSTYGYNGEFAGGIVTRMQLYLHVLETIFGLKPDPRFF